MTEEDLRRYPALAELYMTDPMVRAALCLHFSGHYQLEDVFVLLVSYFVGKFEVLQEKYGALLREQTLANMPVNTPLLVTAKEPKP